MFGEWPHGSYMVATMNKQELVPIEGAHGYFISISGDVYSTLRNGTFRKLRTGRSKPGQYPRVSLSRDGKVVTCNVHTLVARTFLGEKGKADVIRHLDGDPTNNAVLNLAYGTYADNEEDKARHGRRPRGSDVFGSRLSQDEVLNIREKFKEGATCRSIAREYGLHETSAHKVIHGTSWSHLPVPDYSSRPDKRQGSTSNQGEAHPLAKLNRAKVLRIAALLREGIVTDHIAEEFGVSRSCIKHIASGRTWRHITGTQRTCGITGRLAMEWVPA